MDMLQLPKAGYSKQYGYTGEIIRYTIENSLLDSETWELFVNQFRIHPDIDSGWRGEFWGKMMRGGVVTYQAEKNEKLYTVLRDSVEDLLSVQEKSGRISSYPEEIELNGWDMWGRKYVMAGLEYFLEICKSEALKKRIIRALKRHADYILKKVGARRGQKSIFATSQNYGGLNSCSILKFMLKLYNLTGEQRYFDFSTYLVEGGFCADMNLIDLCLHKTMYPYQFIHKKAYEMASCFEGLLEYYKITKNEEDLQAVINFTDMIAETDFTLIGGIGYDGEFLSNSTEGQLEPFEDIAQETCVSVTYLGLCVELLSLTGEAKYVDFIERIAFNILYGSVNNEHQTMKRTEGMVYTVEETKSVPHEPFPFDSYSPITLGKRGKRVGGFMRMQDGRSYGCCACIGSVATAQVGLCTIMQGTNGIYVNLYQQCKYEQDMDGQRVQLRMLANPYGKSGAKITLDGKGQKFVLGLRVPNWAENFEVFIGGEKAVGKMEKGYLLVERVWEKDVVEVKYLTPVKVVKKGGMVAFTRGPIVLCRDERFGEDIAKPVSIGVKNGGNIRAKLIKNKYFDSNITLSVHTKNGDITLCDYAQAGKNYDDENCMITVWQKLAKN